MVALGRIHRSSMLRQVCHISWKCNTSLNIYLFYCACHIIHFWDMCLCIKLLAFPSCWMLKWTACLIRLGWHGTSQQGRSSTFPQQLTVMDKSTSVTQLRASAQLNSYNAEDSTTLVSLHLTVNVTAPWATRCRLRQAREWDCKGWFSV